MKISSIAILLSLGLASSTVYAHTAGDFIVRGGSVYVNPEDNSKGVKADGAKIGVKAKASNDTQLGLNFQYMVTDNIGIELLAATPFSHNLDLDFGSHQTSLGKIKQLPPTLSAVWYPLDPASAFQPYVGAGINYTTFFDEKLSGSAKDSGFRGLDLEDSWGYAVQAGADWEFDSNWLFNAQIRYINIETKATTHLNGAKVTAHYDLNPWVAMVGIGYKF